MKLSLNWLEQYLVEKPNWDIILEKLTMVGIEVEDVIAKELDTIVEFKITPNRGDCLSVKGILREISAITNQQIKPFEYVLYSNTISEQLQVVIDTPKQCPNFTSLIIRDIKNNNKLPQFITESLKTSGYNLISPIVDVTNYVMLSLGQPIHAYDLDKIGIKGLTVTLSNEQTVKLPNEQEIKLDKNTLVICNEKNEVLSLAGIMGSLESSIDSNSSNIVLESAFFTPNAIIGRAKKYAITSEASYRFERGVDYQLQSEAINYASYLIKKYLGGEISVKSQIDTLQAVQELTISYNDINKLIGMTITKVTIHQILNSLGFVVIEIDNHSILVKIPSHRFDIKIKEDLVEEIVRVYGYENIVGILPKMFHTMNKRVINKDLILKRKLVSRGYNEVISYAFLEDKYADLFKLDDYYPVKLQNGIANLNNMRTTLYAGLVKSLQYNINRGVASCRLFECARVFYAEAPNAQPLVISGLIYGNRFPLNWTNTRDEVDFFDIKNDVLLLLAGSQNIEFIPYTHYLIMHPGRCAKIQIDKQDIGMIGQLHPLIGQKLALDKLPYLFEIQLDKIMVVKNIQLKEVSKFPKVERDLCFTIMSHITSVEITSSIYQSNIKYLILAKIFDIYQGNNIEKEYKSITMKFVFQGNKTLTDVEINQSIALITQVLQDKFMAKFRL